MHQIRLRLLLLPWHGILVGFQGRTWLSSIVNHPQILDLSLIRTGKNKLLAIRTPKHWSSLAIVFLFFYLHIIIPTVSPTVLVIRHPIFGNCIFHEGGILQILNCL